MKFAVIALFLLAGCSAAQKKNPETEKPLSFFTNVKGPSKESGDCGGYAFWLAEESGQYVSGDVAEFEGGCGIYRKPITEIHHDVSTGKISFLAPSTDANQLLRFEGRIFKSKVLGRVIHVDKDAGKPVSKHVSRVRSTFKKMDFQKFLNLLPQNSAK